MSTEDASPEPTEKAETDPVDDTLEEIRQAAGAVIESLKWLLEATERVVDDPAALNRLVDGGRSVVEAFIGGFADEANRPDPDEDDGTLFENPRSDEPLSGDAPSDHPSSEW